MRRQLLAIGVATAVFAGGLTLVGDSHAQEKVPGKTKTGVTKLVAQLVGGEVDPGDRRAREEIFLEIDKLIAKRIDKKRVAIRTPSFWVGVIQSGYFSDRKSAKSNRLVTEDMAIELSDGSPGDVPITYFAGKKNNKKTGAKLVVMVLPEGTDAKAYVETNWQANELVLGGSMVVAAITASDKYPIGKQPFLAVFPFLHLREQFNIDANGWYLGGVGAMCGPVQTAASEVMPDRIAALVLDNPPTALTNENSSLFQCVVHHDGETNAAATTYAELNAEGNAAIAKSETSMTELVTWVQGHAGRILPGTYEFVSSTTEEGVDTPWTGSFYIVSPAKRGVPVKLKIAYDREGAAVQIDGENLGEFRLFMNDELLDLSEEVTIVVNGEELVTRKFERRFRDMFEVADEYGEYGRVFPAEYRGFAPSTVPEDAGDGPGEGDPAAGDGDPAPGDGDPAGGDGGAAGGGDGGGDGE